MTERMKGDIIIFDSGDFVCCKKMQNALCYVMTDFVWAIGKNESGERVIIVCSVGC